MIRALTIDLEDLLRRRGDEMVEEVKGLLPKASGALKDSVEQEVTSVGAITSLKLTAAPHFLFVEVGRKPNSKQPPLENIRKWVALKGIPVRAAFPIARAIAKRGIAPKHILKGVIARRQAGIEQQIRAVFGQAVKAEAENLVKRVFPKAA